MFLQCRSIFFFYCFYIVLRIFAHSVICKQNGMRYNVCNTYRMNGGTVFGQRKRKKSTTEEEFLGYETIHHNSVGNFYYILLLHVIFLYDISLQWFYRFLEKFRRNLTTNHNRDCDRIPVKSDHEISGKASDPFSGAEDEEREKGEKDSTCDCNRWFSFVSCDDRGTFARSNYTIHQSEYPKHGNQAAGGDQ